MFSKNVYKTKKHPKIREAFHRFTTINLDIFEKNAKTTQLSYCGLDGTRTRDPLRDRQVF